MLRVLLFLFATAALAAPPRNPGNDMLFGRIRLSGEPGQDVMILPKCHDSWNEPVGRLVLELHGAPFYVHALRVRVDGDQTRLLTVDDTLYPHRPPTFVDVGQPACVTRIEVVPNLKVPTPPVWRQPLLRITGETVEPEPTQPPSPRS